MPKSRDSGLTVGELRRELSAWPDDARITFGCTIEGDPLLFVRFKNRSAEGRMTILSIELVEESINEGSR